MLEEQIEVVVCTREEVSEAIAREVVALVNVAYILHRNIFPHEHTTLAGLEEALTESELVLLQTTPEQKILGSGLIHQQEQALHLGMLAVEPDQQGRGIGDTTCARG